VPTSLSPASSVPPSSSAGGFTSVIRPLSLLRTRREKPQLPQSSCLVIVLEMLKLFKLPFV
jgi:hypothetical protein